MASLHELAKELRLAREISYNVHSKSLLYGTNRGLTTPEKEGYVTYLPTYRGQTVFQRIDDKLVKSSEDVLFLDIGCGNGKFLYDITNKWKNRIKGYGLTAYKYEITPFERGNLVTLFTNKITNKEDPVTIQLGDAHELHKIYPRNTMDYITAVQSFKYLADPWGTLKKVYNVLKPKGEAYIDYFPLSLYTPEDQPNQDDGKREEVLMQYLARNYGMEFSRIEPETYSLSFAKTSDRLRLPLRYNVSRRSNILRDSTYALVDTITYGMTYDLKEGLL